MARQALEGLKVVEVGNIIAGPWCGTLMADFGARVIKVEQPGSGDLIRDMGRIKDLWFSIENRNKMNVSLNLKDPRGKELLWQLIEDADVLIENFRPGVFTKLGFTWEEIHKRNPRLIYNAVSGYGRTGPYSSKPGFDRMGLAMGGFLEVTGYPDTPPCKPGLSVSDFYTAMFGCIAVMFALYDRDVNGSGEGQMIDSTLCESALRIQESIIAEYSIDGAIRTRIGNGTTVTVPAGHFKTSDGKYLAVSVAGDKLYRVCMEKIGRPDLLADPRYQTPSDRSIHHEEINAEFGKWAAAHTINECLAILGDSIPNGKIYNVADIVADPHYAFREDIVEMDTEQFGKIKVQNVAPKMLGTPGQIRWLGGKVGRFNEEVYGGLLGLSDQELQDLQDSGVI